MIEGFCKFLTFHFSCSTICTWNYFSSMRIILQNKSLVRTFSVCNWHFCSFTLSISKSSVYILGNPLKCNCKMLWLSKRNTPSVFQGECYAPKVHFGKELKSLRLSDFRCFWCNFSSDKLICHVWFWHLSFEAVKRIKIICWMKRNVKANWPLW